MPVRMSSRAKAATSRGIAAIAGFAMPERGPWFEEFLVRGPMPAPELQSRLHERGIISGLDVSSRGEPEAQDALLFCVTEATPPAHVEALIEALTAVASEQ